MNVYNQRAVVSLNLETPYFSVEIKPQHFKFEFDDADMETFNKIVELLNRSWIRSDFYKRYTLQDVVGKGGFASVSIANRTADGKIFAAKMIKKERIAREKERVYFIHELKVARELDFPLIVKVDTQAGIACVHHGGVLPQTLRELRDASEHSLRIS